MNPGWLFVILLAVIYAYRWLLNGPGAAFALTLVFLLGCLLIAGATWLYSFVFVLEPAPAYVLAVLIMAPWFAGWGLVCAVVVAPGE